VATKFENKKILKIDNSIEKFSIKSSLTIREAIQEFSKSKGLPLIVINNQNELVGTLSNGDIRRFLSKEESSIEENIDKALNPNPHYVFSTDDKSIIELELSKEETRIVPVIEKDRKISSVAYLAEISYKLKNKNITYKTNSIYLIAEIGVNHNGSLSEAYKLVDEASSSGFDAIKLQFRSNNTYGNLYNNNDIDLGTEYIINELERTNLSYKDEQKICKYIKSKGIDFIGTPFDEEALIRLVSYKPDLIKIASCDLTNFLLLEKCIKTKIPLILSTGMSNETEIIQTNRYLEKFSSNFAFLHCNSTYPTPIEDVQLKYIHRLREITQKIVGYSSHDGNPIIPLAAIAAGAQIIEIHITSNRYDKGTDHIASLESIELKSFVNSAKLISQSLGVNKPRIPSQGELINKISLGKSLCYNKDLIKDTIINPEKDFTLRSPGEGIPAAKKNQFNNLKLKKDVKTFDQITYNDFQENKHTNYKQIRLDSTIKNSLKSIKWGVPVRYRDIQKMKEIFDPPLFEIHLSSKDLVYPITTLDKEIFKNKELIIHAIEQYHDGFILDLASDEESIINQSFKRLTLLNNHCKQIRKVFNFNKEIKLVLNCGGYSVNSFLSKEKVLKKENLLIKNLNKSKKILNEFTIIPQTMPPYPWHQGGRSFHNLLRSTESLFNMSENTDLEICLDFSHTYMECRYHKISFNNEIEKLLKISSHLHISDSSSTSNEGLNIDEGNIDFEYVFKLLKDKNKFKKEFSLIPEVWQGHLNNGEGFKLAINRIGNYMKKSI